MYLRLCYGAITSLFLMSLSRVFVSATCTPLVQGTDLDNLRIIYRENFCPSLQKANFAANLTVYAPPVISLSFTPDDITACSLSHCEDSYRVLLGSCKLINCYILLVLYANKKLIRCTRQFNSHSIFGTGSGTTPCGTYNFTIVDTSLGPVPSATTTLAIVSTYSGTQPTTSPNTTKPVVGSQPLGSGASRIGVNEFCGLMLGIVAVGFVVFL